MTKTKAVFILFLFFGLIFRPVFSIQINLKEYEKTIYSQNGEDGIIEKIFDLFKPTTKYYVEFGGYDGYLCSNVRYLREFYGWNGLLMDGGFENLEINLRKEFITAENINALFEKYHVPHDLDFLSIDIDYNDFYIWQTLDKKYQPKLVVVEYNATHLPHEDKVVRYSSHYSGDGTNYFGASIKAFYQLGRKKGYSLIYADQMGVNLFFLRDDLLKDTDIEFINMNDVENIYAFPRYGMGPNGGHMADPLNRKYIKSLDLID